MSTTKKHTASQNLDETGITIVQDPGRIIVRKDSKQVGQVVTAVVCAMSADGVFVPPAFLFQRKLMNNADQFFGNVILFLMYMLRIRTSAISDTVGTACKCCEL